MFRWWLGWFVDGDVALGERVWMREAGYVKWKRK